MPEIYKDIEQGSKSWEILRLGSIGGSSISKAVAGGDGKTRKILLYRMVQEIISGKKIDHFVSYDMKQGIAFEPAARYAYELRTGIDVEQIGLVKHGEHKHSSPDGFCGQDGIIEIKCRIFKVWDEFRKSKKIIKSERDQMQWNMGICGKAFCDHVTYCPYIEPKVDSLIIVRVERDEAEIRELDKGADDFINDMQALLLRVLKRR